MATLKVTAGVAAPWRQSRPAVQYSPWIPDVGVVHDPPLAAHSLVQVLTAETVEVGVAAPGAGDLGPQLRDIRDRPRAALGGGRAIVLLRGVGVFEGHLLDRLAEVLGAAQLDALSLGGVVLGEHACEALEPQQRLVLALEPQLLDLGGSHRLGEALGGLVEAGVQRLAGVGT